MQDPGTNKIHVPRRRWYDDVSNMTMAIHLSKELPENIQGVIARNLNYYIDTYRRLNKGNRDGISIGVPRVLGLYKASDRKRWYDPDVGLYRAFNMMISVPDIFLEQYAERILEITRFIEEQRLHNLSFNPVLLTSDIENFLKQSQFQFREDPLQQHRRWQLELANEITPDKPQRQTQVSFHEDSDNSIRLVHRPSNAPPSRGQDNHIIPLRQQSR